MLKYARSLTLAGMHAV